MSDPIDTLCACVTSFKRTWHLERCINSIHAAGIRRISIAASEPTPEVIAVIYKAKTLGWDRYQVVTTASDVGCNQTWMLAAYHADRDRIVLLHDDDVLLPEFGKAYTEKISPLMDSGVGGASWRANHLHDDGTRSETEWWVGPTRVMQSSELHRFMSRFGSLSLSPIVSVLDRTTTIRACKEAEATLTHNECLERPGMLLGTEVLVYLRHWKAFPNWFYLSELLSLYGYHDGSGTIAREKSGNIIPLTRGYDRARVQGIMKLPPSPKPKAIFVHGFVGSDLRTEEIFRIQKAQSTWAWHFANGDAIEKAMKQEDLKRTSADLGDDHPVGYLKDYLDAGASMALPEDVIVYTNSDIGWTTEGISKIISGVERGRGVTVCPRRKYPNPPSRMVRTAKNCVVDGGMDAIGVSPRWWEMVRDAIPDFLLGREAWDLCFRTFAEEWADGPNLISRISCNPDEWLLSRAYTDDVIWHEPHLSYWISSRATNKGGAYNRTLAREFFKIRKSVQGLACVQEPQEAKVAAPAAQPDLTPATEASTPPTA